MKKHSSGAGAMLTKTESSGAGVNSFLRELRSLGFEAGANACLDLRCRTFQTGERMKITLISNYERFRQV